MVLLQADRSVPQRSLWSTAGRRRAALTITRSLLWSSLAVPLVAQSRGQDDAAATAQATQLDAVQVTGSRIARLDYESSSPLSTVSAEAIASRGAATIEETLNQLPQLGVGANKSNAGWGGSGQATLNLRGLGAQRNLVLLDGRRMQPSSSDNVVDVSSLPTALIAGVEVISGGASAVYGSDAIAGVINFRLKDDFEGVQLDSQLSRYGEGDGTTTDIALSWGARFADERGKALLSLSWTDRNGVDYMDRGFFRRNPGGSDFRLQTGTYEMGANPPSQAAVDTVFAGYGAAPGRVPATATSYLGFNDDGSLFAANNGPFNWRGSDTLLRDTGSQLNNLNQDSLIQVPLERRAAFARGSFALTDTIDAYAQLQWSKLDSYVVAEAGNTSVSVPLSNPFIPEDLRTLLASRADPDAAFTLHKRFGEAGPRTFERENESWQWLGGIKGRLEALNGSWELYAANGRSTIDEHNHGAVVSQSLNTLINAADGGASICDGGYDPFGLTSLSAQCRSYLVASPRSRTVFEQTLVEASVQGGLFDLPAGELRFAAGLGWRSNRYDFDPDALLASGAVVGLPSRAASDGAVRVRELSLETLVPLLYAQPFAHSLDLGLAYRYSDYNLSGGVDTYKVDLNWRVVESLRLRGGYQRAVRAPSVGELFVAAESASSSYGLVANGQGDQCQSGSPLRSGGNGAAVTALCLAQGVPAALLDSYVDTQRESLATTSGNTALTPETADTYTVGAVWTPDGHDLSLAVDYFDIEVSDVIGTLTSTQVLAACFNQDGSNPGYSAANFYCSQIQRDPDSGRIDNIYTPTYNMGSLHTRGVDLQLDWNVGYVNGATLAIGSLLSWVDRYQVQTVKGGVVYDYADTVGYVPEWKAVTQARYGRGAAGLGLRWRYLGAMQDVSRVTVPDSATPGVAAYHYFDLFGDWKLNEAIALKAGINNLLDKQPPQVGSIAGVTNASNYDIYGRQFYIGISVML